MLSFQCFMIETSFLAVDNATKTPSTRFGFWSLWNSRGNGYSVREGGKIFLYFFNSFTFNPTEIQLLISLSTG